MLRIAKLTDYAMIIIAWLSEHPRRASGSEIAAAVHVEPPTAAKVLKLLGQAGLVQSFRGANGGYRLARNPDDISVAAVIEAMEGPIGMTECAVQAGLCAQETTCGLRGNWQRISQAVADVLENMTIADLRQPASAPDASIPVHIARH